MPRPKPTEDETERQRERFRKYQENWRRTSPVAKAWREKYKPRAEEVKRKSAIKQKYGMTVEDFDSMMESQRGTCAICSRPPIPGRRLDIDHDHATGRVRGLLCRYCNVSMAVFEGALFEPIMRYLGRKP